MRAALPALTHGPVERLISIAQRVPPVDDVIAAEDKVYGLASRGHTSRRTR